MASHFPGTALTLWRGGADGFQAAMLAVGAVQLCGAAIAWTSIK